MKKNDDRVMYLFELLYGIYTKSPIISNRAIIFISIYRTEFFQSHQFCR